MTDKKQVLENGLQGARILRPELKQSFAQDGLHGASILKPMMQQASQAVKTEKNAGGKNDK